MPQNAIIRADGTGDYTSVTAWEAAEQGSDYGAITVGRVDGFFDQGSTALIIFGGWVNGARLEPFDPADGFDGTERQLCGITSSNSTRTIRCRATTPCNIYNLEVFNTGANTGSVIQGGSLTPDINGCLIKHSLGFVASSLTGINGCVLTSGKVAGDLFLGTCELNNSTVFSVTSDTVTDSNTTINNTVVVNEGVGSCIDASTTQNNNASTDTTADTLTNIVVATEFVDSNPTANLDWRIKGGSDLDANGIGAFIQTSGGVITDGDITLPSLVFNGSATDSTSEITGNLSATLPSLVFNGSATDSTSEITGNLSATLPSLIFNGSATDSTSEITGNLSVNLPSLVFNGSATDSTPGITANGDIGLPSLVFNGSATDSTSEITGNLSATLPSLTFNGSALSGGTPEPSKFINVNLNQNSYTMNLNQTNYTINI